VPGAAELLPITFLVIVGTVSIYGFATAPLARVLRLGDIDEPAPSSGLDPLSEG
jgi:NhaP-type Na+/H+ or K+/H+ antiporter